MTKPVFFSVLRGVAFALAATSLAPAEAQRRRPSDGLHCILNAVSQQTIERVGRKMWTRDPSRPQPGEILGGASEQCRIDFAWDRPILEQAASYALATATTRYVRVHVSADGYPVQAWDTIYDTTPVDERTLHGARHEQSPTMSRDIARAMAEHPEDWSRNSDTLARMSDFFARRATAERAERWWFGLPVSTRGQLDPRSRQRAPR